MRVSSLRLILITLAVDEVGYNNALIEEYYHIEGKKKAVIDRAGDECLTPNCTNCNVVWSD